jgi:hypothetical protein
MQAGNSDPTKPSAILAGQIHDFGGYGLRGCTFGVNLVLGLLIERLSLLQQRAHLLGWVDASQ